MVDVFWEGGGIRHPPGSRPTVFTSKNNPPMDTTFLTLLAIMQLLFVPYSNDGVDDVKNQLFPMDERKNMF